MKLYFYYLNLAKNYIKKGISVQACKVKETPFTYKFNGEAFPNYRVFISKKEIGSVNDGWVVLPEPDFEKAKEIYREFVKSKIEKCEEEIQNAKDALKIIEESEG